MQQLHPDALAQVQPQERARRRGKLKVGDRLRID